MHATTKVRIGRLAGAVGAACLGLGATAGVAMAQSMPAGPAPGYYQANTAGSCHGVFSDYFGVLLSSAPGGFSSMAPLGNEVGEDNSVGTCPYTGDGST